MVLKKKRVQGSFSCDATPLKVAHKDESSSFNQRQMTATPFHYNHHSHRTTACPASA